jgi:uncharacterized LabA/DUF88 family protein
MRQLMPPFGGLKMAPSGAIFFGREALMDRFVAFLDVGYLNAASASALGHKPREIRALPEEWVKWLQGVGKTLPGNPKFLRAYWYDGAYDPRHGTYKAQRGYFDRIAKVPGVQLRLGHLQPKKKPKWQYAVKSALKKMGVDQEEFEKHFEFPQELEQKGVDTRITLDIVRLAQNRVYDAAVLVAGDRDLAEPVRVAQDEGCRMVLAAPKGASMAEELKQIADEVRFIKKSNLASLFKITPGDEDEPPSAATAQSPPA